MAFCTNCGQQLITRAKFCPACGTKILATQSQAYTSGYKEKMVKGVEQQLKSSMRSKATSSFQKNASQWVEKGKTVAEKTRNNVKPKSKSNPAVENDVSGGVTIWTWLYLIVNIILVIQGYHINEVLGILLFSVIVLVIAFTRKKKAKPYSWLVKIIVVIQLVFLAALIYQRVMAQNFTFTALLFAALFFVDFKLLFNGNKN
ncbi:zinc ribbon domain-containing protein [Maribellus maritimus]|uniref:zinc ribbon domain-containing protein n=1 Tax=Maribellus maritimus TaxID=2870838 RepID=UPI001EEC7FE8|nr:zinc ribbon domain-containing protein [Maribellus maritimus]MCG6187307.1 zinc ribbon domain-containing protein [Maribellus maritimus]